MSTHKVADDAILEGITKQEAETDPVLTDLFGLLERHDIRGAVLISLERDQKIRFTALSDSEFVGAVTREMLEVAREAVMTGPGAARIGEVIIREMERRLQESSGSQLPMGRKGVS